MNSEEVAPAITFCPFIFTRSVVSEAVHIAYSASVPSGTLTIISYCFLFVNTFFAFLENIFHKRQVASFGVTNGACGAVIFSKVYSQCLLFLRVYDIIRIG